MFEKHAKKGRLVYVAGKLQTRKWRKDGEDSDRFSTEILLVPGGSLRNGKNLQLLRFDTRNSLKLVYRLTGESVHRAHT